MEEVNKAVCVHEWEHRINTGSELEVNQVYEVLYPNRKIGLGFDKPDAKVQSKVWWKFGSICVRDSGWDSNSTMMWEYSRVE